MYNLKGFIRVTDLINNNVGATALLGELSSLGMSFAKEKGFYNEDVDHGYELVSFTSNFEISDVVTKGPAPQPVSKFTLDVGEWAFDNATNSILFNAVDGAYPAYIAALTSYFTSPAYNTYSFTGLNIGPMITMPIPSSADKKMPAWISFNLNYIDPVDSQVKPATVKVWFADANFITEYPDFEIVVVPPVTVIDDLWLNYNQVVALINAFTRPVMMEHIATAANGYPYSVARTLEYTWYDTFDPPNEIVTPWSVIIYGLAGNNLDYIQEALRQYILAHSAHLRPDWEARLPDLFDTTEYVIVPMWHRYSIPNLTLEAGVYSPSVSHVVDMPVVKECIPFYLPAHIEQRAQSSLFMYKSLAFYAVGSPNNRLGLIDFTDVMPDYMAVSTESNDFGKMSPITQGWVLLIYNMIIVAESMTLTSSIPFAYSRIIRDGIMYLAATYDAVEYLVVAKKYFVDNIEPPTEL